MSDFVGEKIRISPISDFLLLLLLSLSLCLNVYLGWKVQSVVPSSTLKKARVGMQFPALPVQDIAGREFVFPSSNGRTRIVYIFRPDCYWCGVNLANIRALVAQKQREVEFTAISTTDGDMAQPAKNMPGMKIYKLSNTDLLPALDFVGTPQTIEISPTGKVIHNWVGIYAGPTGDEIADRFNMKFASAAIGR